MLAGVEDRGAALAVLRGPGTGNSWLPSELARAAQRLDMCVLQASVDSGAGLPYGGLRSLLRPLLPQLDRLPATQVRELKIALGLAVGLPAEPFRVAFAVRALLATAAADGPVVVIAKDVHRLDRWTVDVLCIVARWLPATEPVVVLLTGRAARSAVLTGSSIDQLKLGTFRDEPPRLQDDGARRRGAAHRPRRGSPRCKKRRRVR